MYFLLLQVPKLFNALLERKVKFTAGHEGQEGERGVALLFL
jgi:hypothetical protein